MSVAQTVEALRDPRLCKAGEGFAFFIHTTCTCFSVRHGFDVEPQPGCADGAVVAVASTVSRTRSYWFSAGTPDRPGQGVGAGRPLATVQGQAVNPPQSPTFLSGVCCLHLL